MVFKWILLISFVWCLSLQAENQAVGPTSFNPYLTLNDKGDALIAWNTGGNIGGAIQYALYDKIEQRFGIVSTIPEVTSTSEHVTLALNNQEEALVMWDTAAGQIYYSIYDKSLKKLEAAKQILKAGAYSMHPSVALNDQGDGIAAWFNAKGDIQYANYHKIDHRFGNAKTLRGAKTNLNVQVVMNNIGETIVVWYDRVKTAIQYAAYDKTKFGQIKTILNTEDALNQVIALNDNGEAILVWNTGAHTTLSGELQCAIYDRETHSFGSLQTIAKEQNAFPQIRLNGKGEAIVTWGRITPDGKQPIWYAIYDKTSKSFKTPKAIKKAATYSTAPQVALNSTGEGILTWFTTMSGIIQYALYNKPSELFETAHTIKGTGTNSEYPMIALNDQGQGILVWNIFGAIQYSVYNNRNFSSVKRIK